MGPASGTHRASPRLGWTPLLLRWGTAGESQPPRGRDQQLAESATLHALLYIVSVACMNNFFCIRFGSAKLRER